MKKRLTHTLLCAGVALVAVLTSFTVSASAESRVLTVKLLTGEIVTVTVDVPPGTPVSEIQLPAELGPVEWVSAQAPAVEPTVPPVTETTPVAPTTPAPETTPAPKTTPAPAPLDEDRTTTEPAPKIGREQEQGGDDKRTLDARVRLRVAVLAPSARTCVIRMVRRRLRIRRFLMRCRLVRWLLGVSRTL